MAAPSQDLIAFLSSLALFQTLSKAAVQEIATSVEEEEIPRGATLEWEGGTDGCLYVVVSGRLRISTVLDLSEEVLSEIGPGEMAGGMGFLSGPQKPIRGLALEASRALRFSQHAYEAATRRYPSDSATSGATASHIKKAQLSAALRGKNKLFGALDEEALCEIESDLELVTIRGGEDLFRRGDYGDSLYIVIDGRLRVLGTRETGEEWVLAELGQGESVGEMSVLGGGRRSATVYAVRDTNLARLSRSAFERLSAKYPHSIAPIFIKKVIERLQQTNRSLHAYDKLSTISVAPVSDGIDLRTFCFRLSSALSQFGRSIHVDSRQFDELLGFPCTSQIATGEHSSSLVVERMAVLEMEHRYVVYQMDAGDSAWTRRCVRQADHILLVGQASANPQLSEIENVIGRMASETRGARASLVLLHDDGSLLPSGTRRWLAPRPIERHYHVRMDKERDLERLARVLTDHAIGVVFGGGFARGIAHAGVVRALAEVGIPVDFVGGTSMGACMALEYSLGFDVEKMVQATSRAARECFRGDLTLPLVSLRKGERMAREVLGVMGGVDFDLEDTWILCFCVSANLTSGDQHVHTSGSTLKSLLASCRTPGIHPPIIVDGNLLVDGGIVNNLPVDVMKGFSGGATVIAVDPTPRMDPALTADYGFGVSGWRLLANRMSPFTGSKPVAPSLATTLARIVGFGGMARADALEERDLYLALPLEKFKFNEFHRGPEIAELAYRFALPRLSEWKAKNWY